MSEVLLQDGGSLLLQNSSPLLLQGWSKTIGLPINEYQKAVYDRITSLLPTIPCYDYVPQSISFPYIRLGFTTTIATDDKLSDEQEITMQIHVFSKSAGRREAQTIMKNIYTALHLYKLPMIGFDCVFNRCEYSQADVEPQEGDTDHYQHGVLRFRALITTL